MRFNYLKPATIEEAIALLSKHDGKARVIAGGTDLLVQVRNKAIKPEGTARLWLVREKLKRIVNS